LLVAFGDQLNEAGKALGSLPRDRDERHPSYNEMYFQLAIEPQGPRATLETELLRRGLVDEARHVSINGQRAMYAAWRDFVEDNGEVSDDRLIDMILDDYNLWMGLAMFK
jgi:hypothetical protein